MPPFSESPPPPAQALPAASSSGPSARVVLVFAWTLVALAHLGAGAGLRTWTWPLGYLLLELLASLSLGWRAWRSRGAARRAWGLLALSVALEVPNLMLLFLELRGILGPGAQEGANLLSMATGLLALAGVLSFPRGTESAGRLRRRILDGLIFATALLFLLWAMGLQSSLQHAGHGIGQRVLVAYLNMALLGGGLVFMISDHPERIRGPLGWLGASALAWLTGMSWWTLAGLAPMQGQGGWMAVVGAIPLFQGLAAWSPREVDGLEAADPSGHRLARLLPYLPAVVAVAVLADILPRPNLHLMRGAIGLFLGLVVMLLLRQFQAIQDLQFARRTLEDRVRERTRALEQAQGTLLRTERLNTMALMGAGLAHDLNNLLAAMKASAELAVLELQEGQNPAPQDLERIATAADRAATLTRRLMGFVRQEAEDPAPLDLRSEIGDMEATLRLLVPRGVELCLEVPASGALIVRSTRARLEQMLVNLVANAADAMPDGGRLAIRFDSGGPAEGFVGIEVTDTGCGMTPEVLEQIFDPFFTTKPPGKGTGLGLPSLKALVEEAGGRLEVESQVGKGSRFRILLPAADLRHS